MGWLDGIPGGGLIGGALSGLPGFGGGFPGMPSPPGFPGISPAGNLTNAGGTLNTVGGAFQGAGNAINGLGLPGVPGLPGPGQILNGVGGAVNAVGNGLNAVGNAVGNAFDLPGGHTDNNYNMWVAEQGSPASIGSFGYTGPDQNPGIMGGLGAYGRDPIQHHGPIIHDPFHRPPPVQQGPIVAQPHGTEIGMWGGGLGGGPLGRQWETSGNGGQSFRTSYANNAASPNWREQGAGPFYTRTWGGG